MRLDVFCLAVVGLAAGFWADARAQEREKKAVPLVSGMSITIGNSAGKMDARVQGFGPGFCAGSITVADATDEDVTTGFSAPPLTWTEWFPIFNHVTGQTVSVSLSKVCSTGVIGEVRYWP